MVSYSSKTLFMKIKVASHLLVLTLAIACTQTVKNSLISTPDDFPADEYTINTERDTILVTKNGALLKIPQGAIDAGSKKQVTLEIKEAFTIDQMIRAGLTTRSGEEPMSSGGMIFINTKKGQDASLKKKIDVALPTRFKEPGMKLFKGETGSDGQINWVKPDTLPVTAYDKRMENGKAIFNSKCKSCHSLGKMLTGPDLAHYLRQFSGDTLLVRGYNLHLPRFQGFYPELMDTSSGYENPLAAKLAHLSEELKLNQYIYFCNQKREFGSLGTGFPDLTEADYDGIYQYIQQESDRLHLPMPKLREQSDCVDSCIAYLKKRNVLLSRKEETENKKAAQIRDNGTQTVETRNPVDVPASPDTPSLSVSNQLIFTDKEVVNPVNQTAVYYQFSIETFGWYNVDVLLKEVNGNTKVELAVRITGSYQEKLDVYLIVPDKKIYTKGGLKNDGSGRYAFAYTDGSIYLPVGATAYILGMTENADGVVFALQSFTISASQEISIELKQSSTENFNKVIKQLNMSDIKISAKETKNAESIRKADTVIRNLKEELIKLDDLRPKNCNCDCGWNELTPATDNLK